MDNINTHTNIRICFFPHNLKISAAVYTLSVFYEGPIEMFYSFMF